MSYRSPAHRGVTPQHRGRFPGFDVVDQADNWDAVTTGTVLARLGPATEAAFFTDTEVGMAPGFLCP